MAKGTAVAKTKAVPTVLNGIAISKDYMFRLMVTHTKCRGPENRGLAYAMAVDNHLAQQGVDASEISAYMLLVLIAHNAVTTQAQVTGMMEEIENEIPELR
jgi:hypothetical protein